MNQKRFGLKPLSMMAVVGASAVMTAGVFASGVRADEVVEAAKADVAKATSLQTEWQGPTSAPPVTPGKKIVYMSGDEQIDTSHEYGVYMQQAAAKIGWTVTVIDGKGSPTSWLAAFNQAIALKPDGIAIFADASSLQDPIKAANAQGMTVIGLHATALPGPYPDLGVFFNIQGDPRNVGKIEGEWAIADSDGKARVVVLTHNEYKIAETKSGATKAAVEKCSGCKVLEYANSPASQADQRMGQLTTSWVQRFGPPLYITSVGDNDFDFAVPVLRAGGLKPEDVKLIGADGTRSAYDRLHKGNQYQAMTVSEPVELQAYQAIDEFNRAFNKQPPSGFVQPPYILTAQNVNAEGGDKNVFIPSNDYVKHYLANWGVK
jgi:ribose transport system substrate-binding protein